MKMNEELDIFKIERPWGYFERFTNNIPSTVKIIFVNPNEVLSLQSHSKRSEFWRVIRGNGYFEINDEKKNVGIGSERYIKIGDKHRMSAGENGMEVLEIGLGDFDENDIVRYEEKYGRV